EQWYGDFLAEVGAARIGERRLVELTRRYGIATIKAFIEAWFAYSERRMCDAIKKMPDGKLSNITYYDPLPPILPDGLPIRVDIVVDTAAGYIDVDLTRNSDNLAFGLNESLACATSNAMCGVFNCMDPDVPHNAGSFSRVRVALREGCLTGIPKFPHSCSLATTNIGDRIVNVTQAAFAAIGDGHGLAEGAIGMGAGAGVISGNDWRRNGPFINQEWLITNGGPATPISDGWLNYGLPVAAGLMYRGSVEVDESKYPILVKHLRVIPGGGGAGRWRGAPGSDLVYGPRRERMMVVISCDGQVNPPQGVRGGHPGPAAATFKCDRDGNWTKLPGVVECELEPGEWVRGLDAGGGGYGDPLERDPARVCHDVLERWETAARAREVYGVVLTGSADDDTLAVDVVATSRLRAALI
ncbi:MAG: hydantoinase B/oxoprolinase family protein, partial [Gammaproteobacteria bacterium]